MLFAAYIAVEQDVIVTVTRFWCTPTHSIEAEKQLCFKTRTPEVGLQNLRA